MISKDIAQAIDESVLCWLATCSQDGWPNVSPKEVFAAFDEEHLVLANIASPVSVRNISANPKVCVSFVDVFAQKGFKLSGLARNLSHSHPEFSKWVQPLEAMTQGRFTIDSVIVVAVEEAETIVAPSYRFFPDEVSEASQRAAAMRRYGVRPALD